MVKFTHKLVHRVKHLLHTKFQQSTTNGGDAMTILVMTYFIDGFQPEGPLKRCFDYYHNCAAYWQDVHMLLATAAASDWFTEPQREKLVSWLRSLAKDKLLN